MQIDSNFNLNRSISVARIGRSKRSLHISLCSTFYPMIQSGVEKCMSTSLLLLLGKQQHCSFPLTNCLQHIYMRV